MAMDKGQGGGEKSTQPQALQAPGADRITSMLIFNIYIYYTPIKVSLNMDIDMDM
jgi:hypothetical protein